MSAPKPDAVVRYFSYWEIPNIFDVITRTPRTKAKLRAKLLALVDKRNGIAHGDTGIIPTYHDVLEYRGDREDLLHESRQGDVEAPTETHGRSALGVDLREAARTWL